MLLLCIVLLGHINENNHFKLDKKIEFNILNLFGCSSLKKMHPVSLINNHLNHFGANM